MEIKLYIVATPIGNLKDFSERGVDILKSVDVILCEDTRVASKLTNAIGINAKFFVYNDHNALDVIPKVVFSIKNDSKTYALISDAGTPLISDPGYKLVNACIENKISYTFIPGACSVIAALVLSGLPSNSFMFDGFADSKKFDKLSKIDSTIILFESARRVVQTLKNMRPHFSDRTIAIVREITKIFEESLRGTLESLIEHFENQTPRGEIVIVISPASNESGKKLVELLPLIEGLAHKISTKELSEILSKHSGISKNKIYDFLIDWKKETKKSSDTKHVQN